MRAKRKMVFSLLDFGRLFLHLSRRYLHIYDVGRVGKQNKKRGQEKSRCAKLLLREINHQQKSKVARLLMSNFAISRDCYKRLLRKSEKRRRRNSRKKMLLNCLFALLQIHHLVTFAKLQKRNSAKLRKA